MTSGYLRYPHVHGDQVVFVADDDLWQTTTSGGRAHRLTFDRIPVRSPRFSPSGRQVAFVAGDVGNQDLYVFDFDGGRRRLTWLSATRMQVSGWLDDGHVLLAAMHNEALRALSWLYSVSLEGDLERLPWGPGMAADRRGDGRVVLASPNFQGPEAWKRYRGGMANRVWVSDSRRRQWSRLLPDETASMAGPCWVGERVVFTSDLGAKVPEAAEEQAQVWSVTHDGRNLRAHTAHTFAEGYCRDATTDGRRVVYHARGRLYILDNLNEKPRPIPVTLGLGEPEPVTIAAGDRLETVAPDQGGDGSLVEWRGQAWFLTHRAGPARTLSGQPGVRVREVTVLGSSGKGIWASDVNGEDCLEIMPLDGDGDPLRIAQGRLGRVLALVANADGSKVAVGSHDGTVSVVDVALGSVKKVGRSTQGEATALVFSPCGRYLVWRDAVRAEGAFGRLVGYDLSEDSAFILTRGQFNDFCPTFSLDGKYLYLLSSRTIDPSYDEIGFDLGFTNTVRPYVIPLRAEDPVPFGPTADGWAISEDKPEPAEDDAKPESVVFDVAGAEDRMAPLPVPAGRYDALMATASGVAWRRLAPTMGVLGTGRLPEQEVKDSVEAFDLAKRKLVVLVEACDDVALSGDGRQLVVRNGDELWVQGSGSKAEEEDRIAVDATRLRRQQNPRDEWRQMFDENARLMRDHFWREDMDGLDWDRLCAGYRPLLEQITTHDELVDVLTEANAELNTSHAYVIAPDGPGEAKVAWLGAELRRNSKGEVAIQRILQGESSDPAARSPLRAAGVAAQPGDVIAAIDGQPTSKAPDVGALLLGAAGKPVELTLVRGRMKRRVAVVPVPSESAMRYHEWVASRVARVTKRSKGRVGYVHVPNMSANGWAEFHRLIDAASRCEAVVVDVRFNRGGHTSELVLERLMRTVVGWGYARHLDAPEPYPSQGMRGPVVFVTNPYAASDGDIVTAAAQNLDLGPVVGERSWGGVVGIDGRFELVDGTVVTQPRYGFAFYRQGFDVENHGTDPDIEVPLDPQDWESGEDLQLDVAVSEALARLKATPAAGAPDLPPPRFV
ncbi:MAG: S41 family peptidase [Propionibacteriaceae bacterium]|nr:S41 family peptidase [Propionibacteriaceae bacterium]